MKVKIPQLETIVAKVSRVKSLIVSLGKIIILKQCQNILFATHPNYDDIISYQTLVSVILVTKTILISNTSAINISFQLE